MQKRPLAYQEVNGERRPVQASYTIRAGKVEFVLAQWDRTRKLLIDPVLVYSTYLGGSGVDEGHAIAVDATGIYVTGVTASTDFPQAAPPNHGGNDVFVAKLNPTGSQLLYSTYLGGLLMTRGTASPWVPPAQFI